MNENNSIQLGPNQGVGERMTFLQMISKYSIVIPVIQRDYAQGRKTERVTELRKNFVSDIISFIEDDEKRSHDLDAIYGSTHNGQFIPLDGQQRLTTLFLFHLYIAGVKGADSFSSMKSKLLGHFTYKTRKSSAMFCDKLIQNDVFQEFIDKRDTALKRIDEIKRENPKVQPNIEIPSLSSIIKNQSWFFDIWVQDPTVAGMLVMLDSIEQGFRDAKLSIEKAYTRLIAEDDKPFPPITFLMLPLDGYSRQDDLYIKMNARGVHLTDFENFKAKLEDYLEYASPSNQGCIQSGFDVKWAEVLWRYRGDASNTDSIMERILRFIIASSFRGAKNDEERAPIMEFLLEQNAKTMRFSFSRYCDLGVFHKRKDHDRIVPISRDSEKNIVDNIIGFFNTLCFNQYSPILSDKCNTEWFNASSAAERVFLKNESLTLSERLRLYACLLYISKHSTGFFDYADYRQWIRLIRNLDEATPINNSSDYNKACSSVDDLLKVLSLGVLKTLSSKDEIGISWFRSYQFKEERIKARLLCRPINDEIKKQVTDVIRISEANSYMTGQIGFLLFYANFYNCCIEDLPEKDFIHNIEKLKSYSTKSIAIFDSFSKDGLPISSEYLLERALLTKGFYLKNASANRRNFCNDPSDRDYSWKSMLIFNPDDNVNQQSIDLFQKVLDNVTLDNLENDLRNIINSPIEGHDFIQIRTIMRGNMSTIGYCSQGFITVCGEEKNPTCPDVILLGQSQMNHYHSELRTYDLYSRRKNSYGFLRYKEVKRWEEENYLFFRFIEGQRVFRLKICHWEQKWWHEIANDDETNVEPIPEDVSSLFASIADGALGDVILDEAIKAVNDKIIR